MARWIDVPLNTLFLATVLVYKRLAQEARLALNEEMAQLLEQWVQHTILKRSICCKRRPLGGWKYAYDEWCSKLIPDGREVPYE